MSVFDRLARLLNIRRVPEYRDPDLRRIPYTARSLAGVVITPDTAVTVPAVWACLRYLSQTVAVLPWNVMKEMDAGAIRAPRHPVHHLIHTRPNPEWSSFQFRESMVHWACRWGNGYAEIERDSVGRPLALWPIHPCRVEVCRDESTGRLVYEVTNDAQAKVEIPPEDMFHVRGFGEGPVGVNVIEYAAQSIGWARAAQLFGAAFFGNGMNFGGIVSVEGGLKQEGKTAMEAELNQKYAGPRHAWRWHVSDRKTEIQPFSVEPNKGQFIETNQHLVEEICRWFGVPPHKVAHLLRSTFNNIEHQAIEVVQDSIMPWVKRLEDEADYKLFGAQNRNGYFTKMNLTALLRGDAKSRGEHYQMLRNSGAINADEIRMLEDMNPIGPSKGGDLYVMQGQYVRLDQVGEVLEQPMSDDEPTNRRINTIRQMLGETIHV
jgi:HK97 family phage portal protein